MGYRGVTSKSMMSLAFLAGMAVSASAGEKAAANPAGVAQQSIAVSKKPAWDKAKREEWEANRKVMLEQADAERKSDKERMRLAMKKARDAFEAEKAVDKHEPATPGAAMAKPKAEIGKKPAPDGKAE